MLSIFLFEYNNFTLYLFLYDFEKFGGKDVKNILFIFSIKKYLGI